MRTAILLTLLVLACGPRVRTPPLDMHPPAPATEVGYPPPAAKVEWVPASPRSDAVWLDGEHRWDGRTWRWTYGRWVLAPEGSRYRRWALGRREDGVLFFSPSVFVDAGGAPLPDPPPLAMARESRDVPAPEPVATTPAVARGAAPSSSASTSASSASPSAPTSASPSGVSPPEAPR